MGTEKQIESLEKTNVQLIDELTKLSQKFENEKVMLEQHLNECRNMITNSKVTFSDREKELIDTIVSLTEQCNIAVDAHITEIKNMDIGNMEPEEFVSTWNDVFDETLKQFMQWKYIIAAICTGLSALMIAGNIFYICISNITSKFYYFI
jgi:biotin-(acetyl-CoA carboxylase) ligase